MIFRFIASPWAEAEGLKPRSFEGDYTLEKALAFNKRGYNVFFFPNYPADYSLIPINPESRANPKRQRFIKGSDVNTFEYCWVDLDMKDYLSPDPDRRHEYPTKEDFIETVKLTLAPSLVVLSGNGVHVYWRVTDLDAHSFLRLNRRLGRLFTSDPAVTTLNQLMRYPGTLNVKEKGAYKPCEVALTSEQVYTAEELDKLLPALSPKDEEYCQEHYNKAYAIEERHLNVSEELPYKFLKLAKDNSEVKKLFYDTAKGHRSSADFRLGHLLHAASFTPEEAVSVLYRTNKATERMPTHRYNYAKNIVDKIWDHEEAGADKPEELGEFVGDILDAAGGEPEGTRFPCSELIDATEVGFRLTHVIGLVGGQGNGKCHGKDTPIMLSDGSLRLVQDIVPGDQLMGPDSKPRNVLSVARGREQMYRVRQVNGDDYIVNESHILSLHAGRKGSRKSVGGFECDRIHNIAVRDFLRLPKFVRARLFGYKAPLEFPEKGLALEPYMLGLWLGDGNAAGPEITIGDKEAPLLEYCAQFAVENSLIFKPAYSSGNGKTYRYSGSRRGVNAFRSALKYLGLFGNKHIPLRYRTSSRRQRLELLAGLIDSDGSKNTNCFEITQKSQSLANDIVFLARSLGFRVSCKPVKKTCCNNGVVGTYFRVIISGWGLDSVPVKLSRKRCEPSRQRKSPLLTSISVEPLGVGDYYGFELDGDHLYLLRDFTVTHNTAMSLNLFKWFVERNPEYIHVFVSLEMPAKEIAGRWKKLCGDNTALYSKVVIVGNYNKDGTYRNLGLTEIEDYILALEKKTGKKVGCVVVDHIGVLKTEKGPGEFSGLIGICQRLKSFAIRTNTLFVIQSQTSREKNGGGDVELDANAAYGTSNFENFVDWLLTTWQPLKRIYVDAPHMTITAFKYAKMRHKEQLVDHIKEGAVHGLKYEPATGEMREMTSDEHQAYEFWNKQATTLRNRDRKRDPSAVQIISWSEKNKQLAAEAAEDSDGAA